MVTVDFQGGQYVVSCDKDEKKFDTMSQASSYMFECLLDQQEMIYDGRDDTVYLSRAKRAALIAEGWTLDKMLVGMGYEATIPYTFDNENKVLVYAY